MNLTRNHDVAGLAQWVKDPALPMSCAVVCRHGWDLVLLWLWRRLAATAPIGPVAWEPPYAMGSALEETKRKKMRGYCTLKTS